VFSDSTLGTRNLVVRFVLIVGAAATATQRSDLALAESGFAGFLTELDAALAELRDLETELSEAGAPSWR